MRFEDDPPGPDPDLEDASRAAAFDFLSELLEDREAGRIRSLDEYLRRYRGHGDRIAIEYVRFLDAQREALRAQAPGGNLGPYRLIEHLGSGGQGEVWLAEDTRLERRVAIKRLLGLVTAERRARLEREAQAAARLAHPGIASLLDAQLDGDEPYLVMEYVEGEDLSTELIRAGTGGSGPWIPRDAAELARVARVFERLGRALHVAHGAGLVHRDVKPGNLRLTPAGDPVLLDFGLAVDSEGDSQLTREGDVFGTPAYMSPEQVRGASGEVLGPATDVYSMGASLFEALTGVRPFAGATRRELEHAILQSPLPAARAGAWLLPKDVQAVLQCACDKDRSRRYASAEAFAEDLARLARGEPVRARPVGPFLRLARWTRREPVVATALAGVLLALTTGLVISLVLLGQRDDALGRALVLLGERDDALAVALGEQLTFRVPELMETSPAAALALGVEVLERTDGLRARSALYGPLETSLLLAQHKLANDQSVVDTILDPRSGELVVLDTSGKVWAWKGERAGAPRPIAQVSTGGAHTGWLAWIGDRGRIAYALESGRMGALDLDSGAQLWSLRDEGAAFASIAAGAEGSLLAVQLAGGATRLLRAADGALLQEIPGAGRGAGLVRFAGAGRLLTSGAKEVEGGEGASAHLWSVEDGALLAELVGHGGPILDAACGPHGQRIATAGADGTLRLWDAATGASAGVLVRGDVPLCRVAFGPRGRLLAAGTDAESQSGTWLVDLDSEQAPRFLGGHALGVSALAFGSVEGDDAATSIASAAFDGTVRFWSLDPLIPGVVVRDPMRPHRLLFQADGRSLFVVDHLKHLRCFRSSPAPHAYEVRGPVGPLAIACFDPSGRRVLTAGAAAGSSLRIWSAPADDSVPGAPPAELLGERRDFQGSVHGVVFGPAGVVASHSELGEVAVWSLLRPGGEGDRPSPYGPQGPMGQSGPGDQAQRARLPGPLRALAWAGPKLLAVDADGQLSVAHAFSAGPLFFEPLATDRSHPPAVDVRVRSGHNQILVLDEGQSLRVLGGADFAELAVCTWEGVGGRDRSALGFVAGGFGDWVAVRCRGRAMRAFELDRLLSEGAAYTPAAMASITPALATFTGAHLAVADTAGVRRAQGLPVGPVPRESLAQLASYPSKFLSGAVTCLASDGTSGLVASGSDEGQVSVWRAADGEVVTQNGRHGASVAGVQMTDTDGVLRVLSWDERGSVRVWPVWPGEHARAQMARELTELERRAELGE